MSDLFTLNKIMFVCHGNICRSPMAEFIMKQIVKQHGMEVRFEIASSAISSEEIGNDIHPGTKLKLLQNGIPYMHRQAVRLTAADYDYYDLLVCMDSENLFYIRQLTGQDKLHKIHLLLEYAPRYYTCGRTDIADPWYTDNFNDTFDDILAGCAGLMDELISVKY
jgi:protein-tyrosine phosphatase